MFCAVDVLYSIGQRRVQCAVNYAFSCGFSNGLQQQISLADMFSLLILLLYAHSWNFIISPEINSVLLEDSRLTLKDWPTCRLSLSF